MSEQRPGPRATRIVLRDALHELQERVARLERVEGELAEARAAVRALQRLLPDVVAGDVPRTRAPRRPDEAGLERRAEIDKRVLGAIERLSLTGSSSIMLDTSLCYTDVKASLARLKAAGRVEQIGTRRAARYRVPGSPVRLVGDGQAA